MNTYVIGDIHGGLKALIQVIKRSPIKEKDRLIFLGDYVDGWPESYEVINYIISLKDKYDIITLRGNHDEWFYEFIRTGQHGSEWTQGANATKESYAKRSFMIPEDHERFFGTLLSYYIDDNNRCYVHGGFNRHLEINKQDYQHIYYWDRDLWLSCLSHKDTYYKFKTKTEFKEIFIGHTSTVNWKTDEPMQSAHVWNLDTGAGFNGKLTIMNVETKEYWQSDLLMDLYPDSKGRN